MLINNISIQIENNNLKLTLENKQEIYLTNLSLGFIFLILSKELNTKDKHTLLTEIKNILKIE